MFRLAPSRTVAGIGLARAGDHFEQRGFARAVSSHHSPALAAADGEAEALVNDARSVALVEIFDHSDHFAGARGDTKVEFDDLPLFGQFDFLDLVQCLDAALHLRRFGRVRFETIDEALLFGQHGLLTGEGGLLIGFADGALAFVEIVVAGVGNDFTGIDIGDFRHDAVHEFAIVRSHQKGSGKRFEELLEPDDRFEVEMVGGLVHQQDVGAAEQDPRQRNAHFPAAGERADIAIDLVVLKAEAVEHFAGLSFERIAAEVLVFFLHFAELRKDAVQLSACAGSSMACWRASSS